jgi:MFS family permease
MLFGMGVGNFVVFIVFASFAEALYSPIINVFTFNFTKNGREGTFLTLTAAPTYFTMALTGIIGGFLLEHYYPSHEDKTHKKEPPMIWAIIMVISAISTFGLYLGRDYFNVKDPSEVIIQETIASESSPPLKLEKG